MNNKITFESLGFKEIHLHSDIRTTYIKTSRSGISLFVMFTNKNKTVRMNRTKGKNTIELGGVTFDTNIHLAIHQQMIELGWLDE